MANRKTWLSAIAALLTTTMLPQVANAQNREPLERDTIEATLKRFAADYAIDPSAIDITFGIDVDGHRWRVISTASDGFRDVTLVRDFGEEDMFFYKTDRETLNLIDQGIWSAGTASGAATSADKTPFDILQTEDYVRPEDYNAIVRPLLFHFWTRGLPEVIPFGIQHARVVHGAPATLLYYDENFRSAAYHIPAGLGREQAPTIAVPFPRMAIVIAGATEGEAGGQEFTAKAGEMFLMPANIPVTFWNASDDELLSFVWVMWGDGA